MKSCRCCFYKRKQCFKKSFTMADFFGLIIVCLTVKMMVNHQWDGWTWQVTAYSPTAGWWLADSQIVRSDTEEMPAKDFISFKYHTIFLSVPPQTCPLCVWKTTYKKCQGCYLVHCSRSPSCAPAPLLWTQLAPRRQTLLVHPGSARLSAVTHVSQYQMLFCTLRRRQLSEWSQSKRSMVNSRLFPLSFFFSQNLQKWNI